MIRERLPRPFPGRRVGRRVTTTCAVRDRSDVWPGYTFDILVRPGQTGAWNLPREFTVHRVGDHLRIVHEWSRK